MKFVNVRDLKNKTSEILRNSEKEDVVVTVNGKPRAVLTAIREDDLEDYILAKSPRILRVLKEARGAYRAGREEVPKAIKKASGPPASRDIKKEFQRNRKKIADFCRRNHIRRLSLFGSALRDDFGPESDIDILVEFDPGRVPGLGFFRMENELADLLGRKVDLHTLDFLSRYFRDQVSEEAEVQYVKA